MEAYKSALTIPAVLGPDATARELELSDFLERVNLLRLDANRRLEQSQKSDMGQFLTPAPVAQLMASMFECRKPMISLLDAGAGVGSLLAASVAAFCQRKDRARRIAVTAYEIDELLVEYLCETLALCRVVCDRVGIEFHGEIRQIDFIQDAVALRRGSLFSELSSQTFACAILNPPYRKISTNSETRKLLRQIGIETSNLYTAFLAATVQMLEPSGELVAITPRSFCNGPYFKSFRKDFLRAMALRRLHLFESRQQAFREDEVLQETIILHAIKTTGKPDRITITSSESAEDDFILSREIAYEEVVHPGDPEVFIHIVPDDFSRKIAARMAHFRTALANLGISVSTGRVVDFRARKFLRPSPEPQTAPLIYPVHLERGYVSWPNKETKKPNALVMAEATKELLVPNEHYVLVKRFSSKEEKKRIVAAIYDSERIPCESVGFENHLNYFHREGKGLDLTFAKGLAAFLNSTLVDAFFRQFNGHTQVNAADLRSLKYPSAEELRILGGRIGDEFPNQEEIDQLVERELLAMNEASGDDPVAIKMRIEEALKILISLGLPRQQLNERSALTLLALLDLKPNTPWSEASNPLRGITPIMDFMDQYYGKKYKPNTRETVRRQTVHQFRDAGLIVANPDVPGRPINSPKTVYQIESSTLELLRTYDTAEWDQNLRSYLVSIETLKKRYAQEESPTHLIHFNGERFLGPYE